MGSQARSIPGRDAGECHCDHVTKLQEEMAAVKMQLDHLKTSLGAKPFIPGRAEAPSPAEGAEVPVVDRSSFSESLPFKLGPMGTLATGRIFDNKIAAQADFQFSSMDHGRRPVERED